MQLAANAFFDKPQKMVWVEIIPYPPGTYRLAMRERKWLSSC
jgi:hypothetical protein